MAELESVKRAASAAGPFFPPPPPKGAAVSVREDAMAGKSRSRRRREPEHKSLGWGRFLVQVVIAPLAIAGVGYAGAIGAANIAADDKKVDTPSCLVVYAEALDISKNHPSFRLPDNDPDQERCNVNDVLKNSQPPG
jgi:hypothetical protein